MRDSSKSTLSALKGTMHKSVVGYYRTKDFIKALRRCKTPVEEKALVAKEAAGIRQALRSPLTTADHRYHSLGKLLVLHLLGHTTLYGQVEYIKLAGNVRKATGRPRLNHKRLGYLGCALLLDREQPTLPLICNTINHDLAISLEQNDATIGALASTALGLLTGISSIARELLPDILVMLSEPRLSADVRRRLIACTARAVQANGVESGELFVSTTRGVQPVMHACLEALLADRSEGTLMAYCQLLANLLTFAGVEERTILGEQGRARLLPTLMRVYNGVGSWSPENDLSRMPNPVLQSALLRCFALLGHKDTVSSDFIANSLLHQSSAHNPTTEGRRPSGANNTSSQSSSQPWTLVAVNLLMDRCACILEIEAPAAARAVAIRQLEELLLAEDISDSTVRYSHIPLLIMVSCSMSMWPL
jgi:AP-1 complex subunit gamma-1